jgi:hypothetical protein
MSYPADRFVRVDVQSHTQSQEVMKRWDTK